MFAGEHEAETYEFQRALPVGARPVFAAKMALALVSAILLSGLMWLLALQAKRLGTTSAGQPDDVAIILVLLGLEMFVWAMLFSLLLRRVLVVAILGVAAASVSIEIVAERISPLYSRTQLLGGNTLVRDHSGGGRTDRLLASGPLVQ